MIECAVNNLNSENNSRLQNYCNTVKKKKTKCCTLPKKISWIRPTEYELHRTGAIPRFENSMRKTKQMRNNNINDDDEINNRFCAL